MGTHVRNLGQAFRLPAVPCVRLELLHGRFGAESSRQAQEAESPEECALRLSVAASDLYSVQRVMDDDRDVLGEGSVPRVGW